jgi:glycosyltransferase involved in cell wall biosynthesis
MTQFLAVSVNADLTDEFGHYLAYDRILRESCKTLGGEMISLANRRFSGAEEWVRPTFRDNSWRLGLKQKADAGSRFIEDLCSALSELDRRSPTVLYVYTGSVFHALAVGNALREQKRPASALINLFYASHEAEGAPTTARVLTDVGWETFVESGIVLGSDSSALRSVFEKEIAARLERIPFFPVTKIKRQARSNRTDGFVAYAPGNLNASKGYELISRLSRHPELAGEHPPYTLKARVAIRPSTKPEIQEMARDVERHARAVRGTLSPEAYAEELADCDVVLVPYALHPFATRTSGVAVDAVMAAKPIVATKGTWTADLVQRFDIGDVFTEGDVEELHKAVKRVLSDIDHFEPNLIRAANTWEDENRPSELAGTLQGLAGQRIGRHKRRARTTLANRATSHLQLPA